MKSGSKSIYEAPLTEALLYEPSQLIAQSNPEPLSLPGTVIDSFIAP